MDIQPVIMSGGSGTRLWPMSRAARPKQFLKLVTERTMFQETALRAPADRGFFSPAVIAGAKHGRIVSEQLAEIGVDPGAVILEPVPRNTAAVAAVAAAWTAKHRGEDALALLMPADHHIADADGFRRAVARGRAAAEDGHIVTFGIKPDHPHTGYGYIERGERLFDGVYTAAAFKEKPDRDTAEDYLKSGDYSWNAGIFLFSARAMLAELDAHAPEIRAAAIAALDASVMSGSARRLDETKFSACPSNSIDYAVMEATSKAALVAPVDVGWTDIGSWSEVRSQTDQKTVINFGESNIVRSEGPLIAAAGVDNLIIVATDDAVLVARRDRAQEVRKIVDELKRRGLNHLL